jgi:hypothetical protein
MSGEGFKAGSRNQDPPPKLQHPNIRQSQYTSETFALLSIFTEFHSKVLEIAANE